MPEVRISIGGRTFEVACQEGEQPFLEAAAKLLDIEASVLSDQLGRMPEARMLLMAGLMLADKTAGLEDQVATLREEAETHKAMIDELQARPAPEPQRVEVPVIPASVSDGLAELAARAEALADEMEDAQV
jgi:cell division protein ZapA